MIAPGCCKPEILEPCYIKNEAVISNVLHSLSYKLRMCHHLVNICGIHETVL